jgi:antitoxin (DNA-binding transcriptional repressor) of toxin-antitoxin stability system
MQNFHGICNNLKCAVLTNVRQYGTIWIYYRRKTCMKFVTVRDFRTGSANIWATLPQEQEMIITNNGKPVALLTPISDKTLEETLSAVRRAKAINAVKLLQQQSVRNGTDKMTLEEINAEIKRARKERRN